MKHVKVMDAEPGMIVAGTVERGDLPPFRITEVTKVGERHFHIARETLAGVPARGDVYAGHNRFKVID
ncbi:hypothetical protein K1T35_48180 (plasmid) [Pseudonocardia sp. DSM 110487]|uniref:hypothetical protein n=1 Tax=Pseudonocardia sp. DSM 110487 TaxID=2865833 RepID=UPI001C69A319|nr:hypothetical protein [Pseudonocardia sp. DSM 110487]QYN41128.1 hypothetical protein K1T35_48180 [Pseudonocardia sp. DSM 110487]